MLGSTDYDNPDGGFCYHMVLMAFDYNSLYSCHQDKLFIILNLTLLTMIIVVSVVVAHND